MPNQRFRSIVVAFLICLSPLVGWSATVLQEVPRDALGFVLLHNVGTVDDKVAQMATLLDQSLPRPLSFLKELTGISEGIDQNGDFLLACIPSSGSSEGRPEFCIFMPVADYDQLIKSLKGTTIDGIGVVTIGGEDLLIAHRGDWAVLMNPDQRARLLQLLDTSPAKLAQVTEWQNWIETNDVTIVALASGVRPAVKWAIGNRSLRQAAGDVSDDELFGSDTNNPQEPATEPRRNRSPADLLPLMQDELRKWAAASPELTRSLSKSVGIGWGIRLDKDGNAVTTLRIATNSETAAPQTASETGKPELPPSLYEGGGFVLNGAANLDGAPRDTIAWAYIRRMLLDLEAEEKLIFNDHSLERLRDAVKKAAEPVHSGVVLTQPGENTNPVYTNDFLVLRVASTEKFVPLGVEVMRLWNVVNRDAKGDTHLVFEIDDVKIGDRTAKQYSLDMVEIAGGEGLPEIRQTMEKMFGPAGKLRLWLVPVDGQTVLLASGTTEQVTAALKSLDRKLPVDWKASEFTDAARLLPPSAGWQVFFSPHRDYDWLRRETALIVGVPVIGGPLVKDFPASPPIGIAGGLRNRELWFDVSVPAATIKSAGVALKSKKPNRAE
jgi:hypothetical protein